LFGFIGEQNVTTQEFRLKAEVFGASNPELQVTQVFLVSLTLHGFVCFYDLTP
jgi:hypothetical protein